MGRGGSIVALLFVSTLGSAGASEATQREDFLFGRPLGYVGIRAGFHKAAAQSDIYDFFDDLLTIERSDFDGFVLDVDFGLAIASRADVVIGFEVTRAGMTSEYRDYVEDNDLPIVQDTHLTSVPLTGSLKLYLTPRGREVSRYAFVPAKVAAYVGAGGGTIWYKLEQTGDFVDFVDLSIFTGAFRSKGWGVEGHVFGGAEVNLGPRWCLALEGRYVWAHAGLGDDFVDFDPIDLSGLRITGGINVRF